MGRVRTLLFSVAILLPALVLAVLSWRSLRQEESQRAQEVRGRAAASLRAFLLELEAELREVRDRSTFEGAETCEIGKPTAEPLLPQSLEERIRRESPDLLSTYERAVELEYSGRSEACGLYRSLEAEVESPATRAALLHSRARASARVGRTEEAKSAYEKLACEDGASESGIPYAILARARILELAPSAEGTAEFVRLLTGLDGHARVLLLRDLKGVPPGALESARARAALEDACAQGETADRLVRFGDRLFFFVFRGSVAAAVPLAQFPRSRRQEEGIAFVIEGFDIPARGELLHRETSTEFPSLSVSARLVDPTRVQTPRGRLFLNAALLICLLAALGFGIVSMFRSVRGELRLAKLKSDFVSGVSHELKTPLTSIRMFAEMLESGRAPDIAEYHRLIHQESLRLSRLVENVLDFARIEEGRKTFAFSERSLNDLAASAGRGFRREGVDLELKLPPEPVVARVDGDAVVGAILNLLENAVKYGGGKIELELTVGGKISVRDHGPGIPPGERERIFDKFYRGASAQSGPTGGAGLGLYLVRHTMAAHGGSVSVESEVGEGSRFTLKFPLS